MWLARLGADRQAAHRLHTRATMSQPVPSDIRVQAPPLISEERDWAARVRAGDAAAFERAFRTYHAALCKFACRYVHSPEIAQELVHDVFARLWEERARLSVGRLKSYLYTAVRNLAVSHLRHQLVERRWREPTAAVDVNEGERRLESAELEAAVERTLVLEWLETHPLAAECIEALERALDKEEAKPMPRRRRGSGLRGFGIAAVLALVAGAAALWWLESSRLRPAMREFTTARGHRAAIRFADGTRILLGVDSRLRVPAAYGATAREAYLDGAAYFDVAHDPARPFAVHAGKGVIRDIGTRFGVRAYADEQDVEVVVADGKVSLGAAAAHESAAQLVSGGELSRLD